MTPLSPQKGMSPVLLHSHPPFAILTVAPTQQKPTEAKLSRLNITIVLLILSSILNLTKTEAQTCGIQQSI